MADDFDVEAMLEAPYKRGDEASRPKENGAKDERSATNGKSSNKSRESGDATSKKSRRSRSKSRDREKDRDGRRRKSRSRSHGKDRDKDRRGKRPSSVDRNRDRKRGRYSRSPPPRRGDRRERPRRRSPSPIRSPIPRRMPEPELTPEERDLRTVFCMQLSARIRVRDLEEFFSSVGKVRDVRLITDNKTRRSKGIAYIEFKDVDSVTLALGLNGQKLLGVPIIVQPTQAEKNRAAAATTTLQKGNTGPMRLYVGSLHFNITEDMLRGIFEPFGKIDHIQLIMDPETNRSKGYGFLTFHDSEDAKKALEQLNGFELAGRAMKVGHVTDRSDATQGPSFLDTDELDRAGIDLGATGRLQLMAKLAEGTGFEIPAAAANALNLNPLGGLPGQQQPAPPIVTQCFMLSNMFDPHTESNPNWHVEIRDDVIEECNKHGGILHIHVDRASPQGNVYVKCASISSAVASVNSLHGRWFAGKVITAAYVPLINYHSLFPDSLTVTNLLMPSTIRP